MRSDLIEMKGKYGRWTVIEYSYRNKKSFLAYWKCQCECGTIRDVRGANLRNGESKSCGCLNKELSSKRMKKRVGKKNPLYGKVGHMLGKAHTEKTKQKISKSKKGKIVGKDHHSYNPSLTDVERMDRRFAPEYKKWREEVYRLNNYTCRKCGESTSNRLNAHHIESYRSNPELRTEVSNGITLCEDCHKDFHHQYGYGDNTRAQLVGFLK